MRMMDYDLAVSSGPASEPVNVDQVKEHTRVDIDADDTLLTNLIVAARAVAEQRANRAFFTQTLTMRLRRWPWGDKIVFPRSPLQSVTSVQYTDEHGNTSTYSADNYYVVTDAEPGFLALVKDAEWPSVTLRNHGAILITFVAGWSSVAAVPQMYKQAIMMLVAHWYENRETQVMTGAIPKAIEYAFDALIMMDRVY